MRILLAALALSLAPPAAAEPRAVLVTIDGLRWEEVFHGADPALVSTPEDRARYVDVADRGAALTPFLRSFAAEGALIGDRRANSCGKVENRYWFSYPGYAEMLGGRPNPRIRSNGKTPNDDVTVLEWLHRRPDFAGRVAVFAEWDVVPFIVNAPRSGLPVTVAPQDAPGRDTPTIAAAVGRSRPIPRVWPGSISATPTPAPMQATTAAILRRPRRRTPSWRRSGPRSRPTRAPPGRPRSLSPPITAAAKAPANAGGVTAAAAIGGRGSRASGGRAPTPCGSRSAVRPSSPAHGSTAPAPSADRSPRRCWRDWACRGQATALTRDRRWRCSGDQISARSRTGLRRPRPNRCRGYGAPRHRRARHTGPSARRRPRRHRSW